MTDDLDSLEDKPGIRRNYRAILVRSRWHILTPFLICGLLSAILAQVWRLPYRSEAFILVEQQKVPEQYVTPNIITNLQDRLDSMRQQILSRTRLQALIDRFNLYPRERTRLGVDDLVDLMRKNIDVELTQARGRQGDVTGFRISYSADSARVAQAITSELTSQFIDESMRQRTEQSADTTKFLETQLEEAQKKLASQEAKLRAYKMQFLGELPEQETSNLQILSSLQAQLYAAEGTRQRAEQQRTYLQSLKEQYELLTEPKRLEDGTIVGFGPADRDPQLAQAELKVTDLRTRVAGEEATYGPNYPELQQLKAQLTAAEQAKKELEARVSGAAVSAHGKKSTASSSLSTATQMSLAEIDSRLKSIDTEIANQQKDIDELQNRIRAAQAHLNMTPVRQQQLAEITRTYENSKEQYQSLLQKKLQSELASNLEKRQQGEQFRLLDPASLPLKAEGRLRILGIGWVLGLALGVGLALLLEITTHRVNDDADVKALTACPVFRIPMIRTEGESKHRIVRIAVEVALGILLAIAALGASARTYLMS